MDRFELVEKLVKSAGVSYADAKAALEAVGWDLLDAAVWLEKNGKIETKTGQFTTNPEQQQEQRKQQEEERLKEERKKESFRNSAGGTDTRSGIIHSIIRKAREIIMDNELVVCKRSGEVFLEIPIWLFIILLIVAFWPTVIVLAVVFFIGFRFRLHGPDLGSDSVNRVLNRAENAVGDFIDRMKNPGNNQNRKYYDATHDTSHTGNDDVIDYGDHHQEE